MKTIQIKVSIDGVNYFSALETTKSKSIIDEAVCDIMKKEKSLGFTDDKGNEIYFGSDLVKKSIITIIEL